MKTESEVRDRVTELLGEELVRRAQEAEERLPRRCTHNHQQPLDTRKHVEGDMNPYYNGVSRGVDDEGNPLPVVQTIGLCMLNEPEKHLTICEDPIDAKRCPFFTPAQGKEELYRTFVEQLQDPTWVRENLSEVHALLWVLDAAQTPSISFWKRLWFKFTRIRVKPALPAFDPSTLLLPPSSDNPPSA